ncbi:flagellar assembly peptidoglycan hydrolase FlgJ [Oxalobacteraceae bacterium OM1]|nr:flagellar assembly peptidoglycan hydrolase FlgJ [Oxalobacteraceae bacterium OM1]
MVSPTNLTGSLAVDVKGVSDLRQAAKQNSPEALRETAKQFEALFMNMVMKSMRDATPHDGMFDSEQSRMYTSMLDQQLSQTMASRGVGLADVLVRQLSNMAQHRAPTANAADAGGNAASPTAPTASGIAQEPIRTSAAQPMHVREFADKMAPHAEEASRATGIPAKFMLGQAALESGWGRREIVGADGTQSHNLFGIKAGPGWKGKVVEAATTEYVNGVPQTRVEKFRAYDSYADSFRDYANFLRSNPRYEQVLANAQDVTGFAQGLQRAGYATDPNYAAKLTRIINHSLSA